jgi:hypothetical protein
LSKGIGFVKTTAKFSVCQGKFHAKDLRPYQRVDSKLKSTLRRRSQYFQITSKRKTQIKHQVADHMKRKTVGVNANQTSGC